VGIQAEVSGDILDECFGQFRSSAFRLETLPAYAVSGETERIEAWRDGRARPERSVRTSGYLREVAANVLAGRQRIRVRIVDHPLSDYCRYQMAGYIESAAAGEETRIVVRNGGSEQSGPALDRVAKDFWLFDMGTEDERAVLLEYDAKGAFTGAHLAARRDLASCRRLWALAYEHSVQLNEYLVAARLVTSIA
jgi:hypothetical protein